MITDMTEGRPLKILLAFSVPMLISSMFQQFYNMADSIIAGQFVGEGALAAIGSSYQVTMIFMAIAVGASIGCSVIISRFFGEKQYAKMKTAVYTSLISIAVISILLTVFGLIFCDFILRMLDTPDNIFSDSAVYLDIYIYGLFFLFLYNICTGIYTALGDSKTPLYFLIASSVGNIILNLVSVISLGMGVAGLAWATLIAQGASSILAFVFLMKRLSKIKTDEKVPVFSFKILGQISVSAVPSILQQSFISVGNLLVQKAINVYGSSVIAGYSAAIRLNTFVITGFSTLGSAMSSFTAQNLGAGKMDRVRSGFKIGAVVGLALCIPFILLFVIFPQQLVYIFMNEPTDEAVSVACMFLRIVSPFYPFVMIKIISDCILRGAGRIICFTVSTFTDLFLRVVLSYVFSYTFGSSTGIWVSWPVGWCCAAVLAVSFYYLRVHKKKTVADFH